MVIGGFTEPQGGRHGIGALLCGYYDNGKLLFSGKVGTGFTESILMELRKNLDKIERKTSPFADPPKESDVHWVSPILVAQVKFSEMTITNKMRHPVYLGLRADKDASEVTLETPNFATDNIDERHIDKDQSNVKSTYKTSTSKKSKAYTIS